MRIFSLTAVVEADPAAAKNGTAASCLRNDRRITKRDITRNGLHFAIRQPPFLPTPSWSPPSRSRHPISLKILQAHRLLRSNVPCSLSDSPCSRRRGCLDLTASRRCRSFALSREDRLRAHRLHA